MITLEVIFVGGPLQSDKPFEVSLDNLKQKYYVFKKKNPSGPYSVEDMTPVTPQSGYSTIGHYLLDEEDWRFFNGIKYPKMYWNESHASR